jgi:hypothetical protein
MKCLVSELYTIGGRSIDKPKPRLGHLSVGKGKAYHFRDASGLRWFTDLDHVELTAIGADGFHLRGVQEVRMNRYCYQEWWCKPVEEEKP